MVIYNSFHYLGFTSLRKFLYWQGIMSLVLNSLQRPSFKESQSIQGCACLDVMLFQS